MVKTINTRIQLKSDTEENWRKAVLTADNERGTKESVGGAKSFVPQNGEAIIFEADEDHNYPRLKIGNGVLDVLSLPFVDAGTVNGHTINIDVPSNAVFTDTTYTGVDGITINNDNEIGHVRSITASGPTKEVYKITYDEQGHIIEAERVEVGTVTSVQVQALDPLQSSSSSASSTTLNTTISFKSVDSHQVLIGPAQEGGVAAPSFRNLISDDIPYLSAEKINSGTLDGARIPNLPASKIASGTLHSDRIPNINLENKIDGVLPISHGGTGRNGSAENDSFKNGEVFLYNSTSNRFEQIGITHLANNETFAHYLAEGGENNTAPSDSLLVNLKLLRTAVPPINLKNVADTTSNSYRLSYYAPVSKGRLNSVLISVADADNAHNSNSETDQASVEQIPIWLDPNNWAGVDNSGPGGALYFGRDEEAETTSLNKPFKTQWGTLPVEQGGTGHYEFPTYEGGSVLLGYGKQSLTTIRKSTSHINGISTLVERTDTGDFSTNKITLTSGIDASFRITSEEQEEIVTSNVIAIANGSVTLHGNLDADDLNASIGILNMIRSGYAVAEQPIINWYSSTTSGTTTTNTKLGEIYWDVTNGRGVLTNIHTPLDTTRIDSYYLPPTDSTLDKDNTFTFLATADTMSGVLSPNSILFSPSGKYNQISAILNTAGAFYSNGNNSPGYGILPTIYGGTGTNFFTAKAILYGNDSNTIQAEIPEWKAWVAGTTAGPQAVFHIGNADYTSAAIPAAGIGASGVVTIDEQSFAGIKTFTSQVILSNTTDISGTAASESALIIGNKTGVHLAFDSNEIMAKADSTTPASLLLNYDGGNLIIGKNDANYNVQIRSTMSSSSKTTGALIVGGGAGIGENLYVGGNTYSAETLYVGTSSDTVERREQVNSLAGDIYLYSTGTATGNRGLYGHNNAGTGAPILTVNQSNQISAIATITGAIYLNNNFDISPTGDNGSLIIGDKTAENLAFDANEIMARNNKNTGTLYLNMANSTDSDHLAIVQIGNASDENAYLNVRYKTAATSKTTGALRVGGGAGFGGTVYANAFNGPLTGNVTGNVTGDVTGDVTGNITGYTGTGVRIRTSLTKGSNPSETKWQSPWYNYQAGTGTAITDRVGGGIESYVNASGLSAICLRAYKFAADTSATNSLEIQIAQDGTLSYSIGGPAAFKSALGLGTVGMNFQVTNSSSGTQLFLLKTTVKNSSASLVDHTVSLVPTETGIFMWDHTNSKTIWSCIPSSYLPLAGGTMTGNIYGATTLTLGDSDIAKHWNRLYLGGSTTASHGLNSANPFIEFANSNRSQYLQLVYTDNDTEGGQQSVTFVGNSSNTNVWVRAPHFEAENANGLSITPSGTPWPFILFGTRAGTSAIGTGTITYQTVDQSMWAQIYATVPAHRRTYATAGDTSSSITENYYYSTRFFFREYSKTANTTTRLNYSETYYLPPATDGLTANKTYDILTTKDMSFDITGNAANVTGTVGIAHGGTGATTVAKARQALFGESMASDTEFFITINTNWAKGGYITNAKAAEIIRSNASGSWGINITGTAAKLAHTTLNSTTINNTAGSFAFSGSGAPWEGEDWVGLQIGDSVDKFQVKASSNTLLFRHNDNGGTNTSWNDWVTMLTSANYTSYTVTKTGSGASGTWSINVTGSSGSCTGHAASDLALTGGTLTGNVHISGAGERYCRAINTNTQCGVYLDSSGGADHGIWSSGYYNGSTYTSSGKWMIYRNSAGTVTVEGNCTGSSTSVSYSIPSLDFSKTNFNISSQFERNICWHGDSSGNGLSRLNFIATTDGTTRTSLQTRTWNTSGSAIGSFQGISIIGKRDNTVSYSISNAAAFRTALGLGTNATSSTAYLPLAGGTMTDTLTLKANLYKSDGGGINCNNADIINLNSLWMSDKADSFAEGICFVNGSSGWDCMAAAGGAFYFRKATDASPGLSAANATADLYAGHFYGPLTGAVTGHASSDLALSGGTMTGTITSTAGTGLTIKPASGTRAYLNIVPQGDNQADLNFGRSNANKWALSSRTSSEAFFGLYNHVKGTWSIKVAESDHTITLAKALPIASGGTGSSDYKVALRNLYGTPKIDLSDSTKVAVFNTLKDRLRNGDLACIDISAAAMKALTANSMTVAYSGLIYRSSSSGAEIYHLLVFSHGSSVNLYRVYVSYDRTYNNSSGNYVKMSQGNVSSWTETSNT